MKVTELKQIIGEEINKVLNENLFPIENFIGEGKSDDYPKEVNDVFDTLVKFGMKRYQLSAKRDYGVWLIELPFTAMPISGVVQLSKVIDGNIGIYPGYSGLTIKTNIKS
jgi:hypothetical protein